VAANESFPVVLSPVESYFWRAEEQDRGYRCAALVKLDGCTEAEPLAVALREIQRRHPKLRAAIVEGSDYRLRYHIACPAPPIPFEIRDFSGPEMPWRDTTREMLAAPFPDQGPYAAVTVLRNRSLACSEVILVGSHAFVDGMSALVLLSDLLAAYAKAEAEISTVEDPALPLISAPRALSAGSWRQHFRVLRRFRALRKIRQVMPGVMLPHDPSTPPLSQWMHWGFSPEDTLRIVRRCRREQVSVHCLLLASVFCSVRGLLGTSGRSFRFHSPFNVRTQLQGPDRPVQLQDLGCFMSNMNGLFPGDLEGDVWEVARYAQKDIESFKAMSGPSFGYNIASFFYNLTNLGRQLRLPAEWLSPREERVSLLATNYGVAPLQSAYGSLRTRACTLMFKNDSVGAHLVAEALVLGQELNVGFAASGLTASAWESLHTEVWGYLSTAGAASAVQVAAAGGEGSLNTKRPRSTRPTNV